MKLQDFTKEELIYALENCTPMFDPIRYCLRKRDAKLAEEYEGLCDKNDKVLEKMKDSTGIAFLQCMEESNVLEKQMERIHRKRMNLMKREG